MRGRGPGLRFCDDFESKAVGTSPSAAPWAVQLNGSGAITIDGTTPAHSGSKSVRVHAGDNDYQTLFTYRDSAVLPAPNGRFFVRAYMRLGRAMAGGHNTFIVGRSVRDARQRQQPPHRRDERDADVHDHG